MKRKGQSSLINLVVVIIAATVLFTFFYYYSYSNRGSTQAIIQDLYLQTEAEVALNNMFFVSTNESTAYSLAYVAGYGTFYGDIGNNYRFKLGGKNFRPENRLSRYFNRSLSREYYFYIERARDHPPKFNEERFSIGNKEIKESEKMYHISIDLPIPDETLQTTAHLYVGA